jgi:hypothetical protein
LGTRLEVFPEQRDPDARDSQITDNGHIFDYNAPVELPPHEHARSLGPIVYTKNEGLFSHHAVYPQKNIGWIE